MLTAELFKELVEAASRAPSADNMQAWGFAKREGAIEVFLERRRVLPTDVSAMFGWIGIGAAVENLVIAAARRGLAAAVEYGTAEAAAERAAVVRLSSAGVDDPLADSLLERDVLLGPETALVAGVNGVGSGTATGSKGTGATGRRRASVPAGGCGRRFRHRMVSGACAAVGVSLRASGPGESQPGVSEAGRAWRAIRGARRARPAKHGLRSDGQGIERWPRQR